MPKKLSDNAGKELSEIAEAFSKELKSKMHYRSQMSSEMMSLDWVNEIENSCIYLDNVIRNPKVTLISEEDTVKIEKAKKITVASVKDLSKHTYYIDKVDPITGDVEPAKILEVRSEETYNTYENRFLYTLLNRLTRFVAKKEEQLNEFEAKNFKLIEYQGSSILGKDKINIELKIDSKEMPNGKDGEDLQKEIEEMRAKIKKMKEYLTSWNRSVMVKALIKLRAPFVTNPIKKTNLILKNPNFQVATRLWDYLQRVENGEEDDGDSNSIDNDGNDIVRSIIDDTFLTNFFVLNSICASRKEEKEKLASTAIILLKRQVERSISLLMSSGIDIDEEEILSIIAKQIEIEKEKRLIGANDVKNKFKNAMDEYIERTKEYL